MSRILFVEDELHLAQIVLSELQDAGFQIMHVADGLSALKLFQSDTFDLVILDWGLPGLNGLDVLRRIRFTSPIPVLMLTARGDPTDRIVGLEVGADDYLVKPFNLKELVARVRALLRRAERIQEMLTADLTPPSHSIEYEGLVLNQQDLTCSLGGEEIDLTPIEFEMLSLLLSHPGRTFNRAYLVETIWKASYLDGDRAVDNAILRLRKKLRHLGDHLETVRGMGYRIRKVTNNHSSSVE